jgi:hypothetical protein
MDMNLDPELALHRSSRLGALADELAESGSRVRVAQVGPSPAGDGGCSPLGLDAVARREAASSGLVEQAARLASIAADLRRYARSAGEHDAAVADGARRMTSRLPSVIHPPASGGAGAAGGPGGWPL